MASGFTSGGSLDAPIERDEEWLKAQRELDEARARKAQRHDGRSLYEVLQSNKAAKQEQFEESIKLKNQFRALDDDEVDFLDSVAAKQREREVEIERETQKQLEAFTRARDTNVTVENVQDIDVQWRKRPADKMTRKVTKLARTSRGRATESEMDKAPEGEGGEAPARDGSKAEPAGRAPERGGSRSVRDKTEPEDDRDKARDESDPDGDPRHADKVDSGSDADVSRGQVSGALGLMYDSDSDD